MTSQQFPQIMFANDNTVNFFIKNEELDEYIGHENFNNSLPNLIQNILINKFLPPNYKVNNLPLTEFPPTKIPPSNYIVNNSPIIEYQPTKILTPPPNYNLNNNSPVINTTANGLSTDEFLNEISKSFSPEKLSNDIEFCLTWLLHDSVINNLEKFSILLNGVCYLPKKDQDKLANISKDLVIELLKLPLKDDKIIESFDKYYWLKYDLRSDLIKCMNFNQLAINKDPNLLPEKIKSLLVKKNKYLLKELNELKEFINDKPIGIKSNDEINSKECNYLTKLEFNDTISKLKNQINNLENETNCKINKLEVDESIKNLEKRIDENYLKAINEIECSDIRMLSITFDWKLNLKLLNKMGTGCLIKSNVFYCKSLPWYLIGEINLYNGTTYLGLYLATGFVERNSNKSKNSFSFQIEADFDIRILSLKNEKYNIQKEKKCFQFNNRYLLFGWNYFTELDTLLENRDQYIDDGLIHVFLDLTVKNLIRTEKPRKQVKNHYRKEEVNSSWRK